MEYHRKQAKALVRAYRAGEREAVRRVDAVLGDRAQHRFLLSDAQHVIAREQGRRSWPDFVKQDQPHDQPHDRLSTVRDELDTARANWGDTGEVVVGGGVQYVDGDEVLVHVRKRGHRYTIDDSGGAVERAGRPLGWLEVARRVAEDEHSLNVNRRGVVFVPAVEGSRLGVAPLVLRIADASRDVYQELLDLE